MYLKEIKASGFKSFADKISIELGKGITGIVGPNGSGKSNVVDAVRWVLGEQSVKSLRGKDNMTDVIFSGSKSRNPMNVATVSLVFDNSDHYLPLEYDEAEIKRRVYKDGTNDYFINGEKVRLKDIVNLLLDSGIAKESFNIISQGKIEEVINSKPTDRRVILEEAAGVLKYKRRKEEALRKLDKMHNNISRVKDIINEIEPQIEPLRIASEKAVLYKKTSAELEEVEVALITHEITELNYSYQKNKEDISILERDIMALQSDNAIGDAKILEFKTKLTKLDNDIHDVQNDVLMLTEKCEKLNGRKALIMERKNYEAHDERAHQRLVELKEKSHELKNMIEAGETDMININKEMSKADTSISLLNKDINDLKDNKSELEKALTNIYREKNNLDIKRDNLINSIDNNLSLPAAVKNILDNPKLTGIHNTIGNLIETEEESALAVSTAIGFNLSTLVVDNDKAAKEAICTIRNIGRATFFPLDVIKPKYIDSLTNEIIDKMDFDVLLADTLVKYDKKYDNIIKNVLGNILVVSNIDEAMRLARAINYKYRIVTYEGELIHAGGSITGGKAAKTRNVIADKYELEKVCRVIASKEDALKNTENKINEIDYSLKAYEDKLYLVTKDRMLSLEKINSRKETVQNLKASLEQVLLDLRGQDKKNSNLSNEEDLIIKDYYEALALKQDKKKSLEILINEKKDMSERLEEAEALSKKENSEYNIKSNELKNLEIEVNRMDVKLDNLLATLNDTYSTTYENATKYYKLDMPYKDAKSLVSTLKRKIREIGVVNMAAPEEFERVNERYEFLNGQLLDLSKAEDTLLDIIDEMDKVMTREFDQTYKTVNTHFGQIFKELFKGGSAELKLTDPSNLLETGIDIVASPPGKKLKNIFALSGGEKTLTAISLLFAIIKSRPAPFCILDEVEAALDEANVDTFGQYVTRLKEESQFILITHKKKTMEYADILYGITMQESGVSKLVGVKLEDIEK